MSRARCYAIFYEIRPDGKLARKLGTDCLFPLDGRLSTSSMLFRAFQQKQRLRTVAPNIVACKLAIGDHLHPTIYDLSQSTPPVPGYQRHHHSPALAAAIEEGVID